MGAMAAPNVTSVGAGARAVAPLALAIGAFGITFGVLAREAGFGPVSAVVFSATTFAGSAQFAATSLVSAGGTLTAAIAQPSCSTSATSRSASRWRRRCTGLPGGAPSAPS
jgi:predicted branched-subunit amino acid permease